MMRKQSVLMAQNAIILGELRETQVDVRFLRRRLRRVTPKEKSSSTRQF
jgi:hypothetical protein